MKDEFYIYRLNNGGSMNDSSDYVLKSSKIMAELAIQMDMEGPDNILQEANSYSNTTNTKGSWLQIPRIMVVPSNYEKSHQISQHGHQDKKYQGYHAVL